MPGRPLPTIKPATLDARTLKVWERQIRRSVQRPATPKTPWNFACRKRSGGLRLTWAKVRDNCDGYEIIRSTTQDFDTSITDTKVIIIRIPDPNRVEYFDSDGARPGTFNYKIRATNGTAEAPQSIKGAWSGIVGNTSIDATDSVTGETIDYESSVTDADQRRGSRTHFW